MVKFTKGCRCKTNPT